jgi:hypothetical protein
MALAGELAERVRPVTLSDDQRLPALPALEAVLPGPGLRRGSVVALDGPGATSLLWALLAPPTAAGSWAALVGLAGAGLLAAAEAGVDLGRLAVVRPTAEAWAPTLAALLDGFDLVVAAPDRRVRPADGRRLTARVRERGTVLLLARGAGAWPEAPDLHLTLSDPEWEGLAPGRGHLRHRRVHVAATGRREAARPRAAQLCLPVPLPLPPVLAPDPPPLAGESGARTVGSAA